MFVKQSLFVTQLTGLLRNIFLKSPLKHTRDVILWWTTQCGIILIVCEFSYASVNPGSNSTLVAHLYYYGKLLVVAHCGSQLVYGLSYASGSPGSDSTFVAHLYHYGQLLVVAHCGSQIVYGFS